MKLTLKQKLIIPTVILILIGMGTLSVVSFIQSKKALQNSIIGQLENRADATVAMLASWMGERRLNVESWTGEKTFPAAVDNSWVDAYTRKKAGKRLTDLKPIPCMKTSVWQTGRGMWYPPPTRILSII